MNKFFIMMLSFTTFSLASANPGSKCVMSTLNHLLNDTPTIIIDPSKTSNYKIAHKYISEDLRDGEIISIKKFGENGNMNSVYVLEVKIKDAVTGEERVREAIFKPRTLGDADGWNRTPMEYVAYHLNQKLGHDYVPPTAYRRGLNLSLNGQHFTEGSLIYKVPGFTPIEKLPLKSYPLSHEAVISDNRVQSVLMHNPDGHSKNLGTGAHWVDGQARPVFIDWGASFRPGTHVTMTHYTAHGNTAPVTKVRKKTFEALKRLNKEDFKHLVDSRLLTKDEVNALLSRRDGIVKYFQRLGKEAEAAGHSPETVFMNE